MGEGEVVDIEENVRSARKGRQTCSIIALDCVVVLTLVRVTGVSGIGADIGTVVPIKISGLGVRELKLVKLLSHATAGVF